MQADDERKLIFEDVRRINSIRDKFKSGNEVPVPEVRISREDWEAVERYLKAGERVAERWIMDHAGCSK